MIKIRYCAEKILIQVINVNPKISEESIIAQLHPLKYIRYLNDQICIPIIISNLKPDEEEKLKEFFRNYLNKLKNVQLTDLETLSNIEWTRFISPIEERFEDIAEWNRRKLLDLPPPTWMVPEEINATIKEIEELSKKPQDNTNLDINFL